MIHRKYKHWAKGMVFGRLTLLEKVAVKKNKSYWLCQCECGNTSITTDNRLREGKTRSCGCLKSSNSGRKRNNYSSIHPLYRLWIRLKRKYPTLLYEAWVNNPDCFISYFLAKGWQYGQQIKRINPTGNYTPKNIVMVSVKRQSRLIQYNGKKYKIGQLSKESGIEAKILYMRIYCYGWNVEKAINEPVKRYSKK